MYTVILDIGPIDVSLNTVYGRSTVEGSLCARNQLDLSSRLDATPTCDRHSNRHRTAAFNSGSRICHAAVGTKQVCVEPPPSAPNMTLPTLAAELRRLQHGDRSY